MIKMVKVFCCLLSLVLLPKTELLAADSNSLCIASFNLRFASPVPPNAWQDRRPVMRECILKLSPDIMGTQEGVYHQLKNIATDLPDYEWLGLGRDGGSRGEFMAIFYRKARFEPLEFDHFWLSDTPDVIGSSTWGNSNRRMVTWVRFFDRNTKREFYFFNTHFDHKIQEAREKSAKLLRERIEKLKADLPVILVGDFNAAAPTNRAYRMLTQGKFFTDTWLSASERKNEGIGTFNGFSGPVKNGARIDWILTRGNISAESAEIFTFSKDGQYPSDHFPIFTRLKLD
jgi:endonuclease/exonuclease/phosphatase family metal-dependent hydrolase